ncbi:hypothetical protein D3C77_752660 [compost metagenome]
MPVADRAMLLTNPLRALAGLLITLLASCTTQLTEEGEKVGLVTAAKASRANLSRCYSKLLRHESAEMNAARKAASGAGGLH